MAFWDWTKNFDVLKLGTPRKINENENEQNKTKPKCGGWLLNGISMWMVWWFQHFNSIRNVSHFYSFFFLFASHFSLHSLACGIWVERVSSVCNQKPMWILKKERKNHLASNIEVLKTPKVMIIKRSFEIKQMEKVVKVKGVSLLTSFNSEIVCRFT